MNISIRRLVDTFDLSTSQGQREYEDLVNRPGVSVLAMNDFFGVLGGGSPGEGASPLLLRAVDYQARDTEDEAVYLPPLC